MAKYAKNGIWGAYLSALNMIEWGIPEKMLGLGGGSSSKGSRHFWEKNAFSFIFGPRADNQ